MLVGSSDICKWLSMCRKWQCEDFSCEDEMDIWIRYRIGEREWERMTRQRYGSLLILDQVKRSKRERGRGGVVLYDGGGLGSDDTATAPETRFNPRARLEPGWDGQVRLSG